MNAINSVASCACLVLAAALRRPSGVRYPTVDMVPVGHKPSGPTIPRPNSLLVGFDALVDPIFISVVFDDTCDSRNSIHSRISPTVCVNASPTRVNHKS